MKPAAQILRCLHLFPNASWQEETLAEKLNLTPQLVRTEIETLKNLGLPIIEEPFHGFRLLFKLPDLLLSEIIESYLEESPVFWQPIVYRETASTSDLVNQLAAQGEREGLVIFAESQTKGRGRGDRIWESQSGLGLWFSLLLRPHWNISWISRLTIITAAAVVKGIESVTSIKLQIKWPNDIVFEGKKIGGILTEVKVNGRQIHSAVIGIGLNINHRLNDFSASLQPSASSLQMITGRSHARAEIAAAILNQLLKNLESSNFEESRNLWRERCITLNQEVTLTTATGQITGRAESIAEEGSLLIRDTYGYLQGINSGEIT